MKISLQSNRIIWILLIVLILFIFLIYTFVVKNNSTEKQIYSCEEGEGYKIDGYMIYNNVWNKQDAGGFETYKQCIQLNSANRSSTINAGWFWFWPKGSGLVKAYPEIIYGWAPWLKESTNKYLPVHLSKMGSFVADYDIEVSSQGGSYNVAFDLWITSSIPPTPASRTAEIMIWVDNQNMNIDYSKKSNHKIISVDGHDYNFWVVKNPNERIFIAFVSVEPILKGSISLDHFVNYLISEGHLPNEGYLSDIEFGNEIAFGFGQTKIRNYSIRTGD